MFDPLQGITEDAATGSAAGALASLLAERESLAGTGRYWFWQGGEISRPSLIAVEVTRDGGQVQKTKITGQCVEVIQGTLTLS
jgi:trans-2,3-dihydro-3-hydroxyanthranilate isomerase